MLNGVCQGVSCQKGACQKALVKKEMTRCNICEKAVFTGRGGAVEELLWDPTPGIFIRIIGFLRNFSPRIV